MDRHLERTALGEVTSPREVAVGSTEQRGRGSQAAGGGHTPRLPPLDSQTERGGTQFLPPCVSSVE